MVVANSKKIISNCYYTQTLGTAQGKKCQVIKAGENIAVDFSGNGTVYDVSGITAYATGMEYGDWLIAGASQKVGLTLGHNDPEGQSFLGYSVSNGTLSGTENPYQIVSVLWWAMMEAQLLSRTATTAMSPSEG